MDMNDVYRKGHAAGCEWREACEAGDEARAALRAARAAAEPAFDATYPDGSHARGCWCLGHEMGMRGMPCDPPIDLNDYPPV